MQLHPSNRAKRAVVSSRHQACVLKPYSPEKYGDRILRVDTVSEVGLGRIVLLCIYIYIYVYMYIYIYIYIVIISMSYIYIYICVCVCVCTRSMYIQDIYSYMLYVYVFAYGCVCDIPGIRPWQAT